LISPFWLLTALVGIIVERIDPEWLGGANWAVKGVSIGRRSAIDAMLFYEMGSAISKSQTNQSGCAEKYASVTRN
jgi:hypothetical protein